MKAMRTRTIRVTALAMLAVALSMGGCVEDTEPVQAPAPPPVLTVSPASVSLAGTAGRPGPDAVVRSDASHLAPDLAWRAASDAAWLSLLPASGVPGSSSGELSLRVSTDGLAPGLYLTTVSLTVEGIDGILATVPVTVELQAPEDPEVVAARTFWQSGTYRSYWDLKAPGDVRTTLLAYTFPEYGLGDVDEVHVKAIDFGYVPELYVRPVARAHCEVSFMAWEDLTGAGWEEDTRRFTRYWGEVDVILQVAPGPYSTGCNGWSVVDLQNGTMSSASTSVSNWDGAGDDSDCGCEK
jgi:hypothetical protein